jgi:hypothetical protein
MTTRIAAEGGNSMLTTPADYRSRDPERDDQVLRLANLALQCYSIGAARAKTGAIGA